MIALVIDVVLLTLLMATAVAIARTKDLFSAVMLTGIYGLLSASFFVSMDAVDVAFTEAAVGSGISPLLMLATLAICGRHQAQPLIKPYISVGIVAIAGALLIWGTIDMPAFGDPNAPAHQHVAPRYLNDSMAEIGIPNVVTSVLASYRGFDTFGEVVVVFTAGLGVLSLLLIGNYSTDVSRGPAAMYDHKILRIISKILIPPILIFALYVQFHGEYSPGGGFQAGVIFAVAFIIYSMLFGQNMLRKIVGHTATQLFAAFGVLLYGSVGVVTMLAGKNFLDYSALAENPVTGQHIGIIVIELGVGITVASVMILIFSMFTERLGYKKPESVN